MAECFFCGADEKLTRAHLFQQLFRDAINIESDEVALAASSVQSTGAYRDVAYRGDIRHVNVTSLCVNCNSGWMNDIETAAGPVFGAIMAGKGFPPPADLFKLAHWSVVVGALLSEIVPRLEIPVAHRRAIRFTRTGQPAEFSTHLVFTLDHLPSLEFDIVRVVGEDEHSESVGWCSVLHAGGLVLISASPVLTPRVSRVLRDGGVHSVLGAISSNLVYLPQEVRTASTTGVMSPSHDRMRDLHAGLFGAHSGYLTAKSPRRVVNLDGGPVFKKLPVAEDYEDSLIDVRDELDLGYLARAFE